MRQPSRSIVGIVEFLFSVFGALFIGQLYLASELETRPDIFVLAKDILWSFFSICCCMVTEQTYVGSSI